MAVSYIQQVYSSISERIRDSLTHPLSKPTPLLLSSVTGSLAAWLLWKTWRNRDRKYPPSPRGWPFFGNALEMSEDTQEDFIRIQRKYNLPDVFSLYLYSRTPTVILNSYAAVRDAFVTEGDLFANRPISQARDFTQLYDEIMFKDYLDPTWMEGKTEIVSALRSTGFGSTKASQEKIEEQLSCLYDYLEIDVADGRPIDMINILPKVSANVIFQILFNKTYHLEDPYLTDFIDKLREWVDKGGKEWFLLEMFPKWFSRIFLRKKIRDIIVTTLAVAEPIRCEVAAHLDYLDVDSPRNFTDVYLAKKNGQCDVNALVATLFTFLPDSIETISAIIAWIVLYVTHYPDVQRRAQNQLSSVTRDNRHATWTDRKDLPYIEAVMMEVMRIIAPVPMSLMHTAIRDARFHGYYIDTKVPIIANLYAAMRDPDHFENPDEFNPDRFLDKDGTVIKSEAWIPFGLGRRRCLGDQLAKIEIFVFTANLLQRYNFRFPELDPVPSLEAVNNLISRVPRPFRVILEHRLK